MVRRLQRILHADHTDHLYHSILLEIPSRLDLCFYESDKVMMNAQRRASYVNKTKSGEVVDVQWTWKAAAAGAAAQLLTSDTTLSASIARRFSLTSLSLSLSFSVHSQLLSRRRRRLITDESVGLYCVSVRSCKAPSTRRKYCNRRGADRRPINSLLAIRIYLMLLARYRQCSLYLPAPVSCCS